MESNDEYSIDSENTTSDEELEYSDGWYSEDETSGSYSTSRKNDFEVISVDDVYKDMADVMLEASSLINLPMVPTRMLLNFFRWDICELRKRFLSEGRNSLCEKVGICNQERTIVDEPNIKEISADVFECGLCKRQSPVSTMKHVNCGHIFCTECWSSYWEKETIKKDRKQLIVCPHTKCYFPVDNTTVMKTVKDPEMEVKYRKIAIKEFVQYNQLMRYCPSPDCSYIVKVKYSEAERVICKCLCSFCFQCGESWHDPVPCTLLKRFNSKWNCDTKTLHWMADNAKCCPNCAFLTEKFCCGDRVFCKSCQFLFCWLCLEKWNDSHNCFMRLDEKVAEFLVPGADDKIKSAENQSKSYWSRYIDHCKLVKHESHLLQTKNLEINSIYSIENEILINALTILCSSRETIIFTYIFASFLVPSNYSQILEINYTAFEKSIEKLSKCFNENADSRNYLKNDIENKLLSCQVRKEKLLEFIHHGKEAGWWTFSD